MTASNSPDPILLGPITDEGIGTQPQPAPQSVDLLVEPDQQAADLHMGR